MTKKTSQMICLIAGIFVVIVGIILMTRGETWAGRFFFFCGLVCVSFTFTKNKKKKIVCQPADRQK